MIETFAERCVQKLAERRQHYAEQLVTGAATDHADYKHRTGKIKGLDDALEIINETFKEIVRDDDD